MSSRATTPGAHMLYSYTCAKAHPDDFPDYPAHTSQVQKVRHAADRVAARVTSKAHPMTRASSVESEFNSVVRDTRVHPVKSCAWLWAERRPRRVQVCSDPCS
jgi:hypothetical protein